jgi:hypothetical protein
MGLCDEQREIDIFGTLNMQSGVDVFRLASEVRTSQLLILDFPKVKIDLAVISKALPSPGSLTAVQSLPWR